MALSILIYVAVSMVSVYAATRCFARAGLREDSLRQKKLVLLVALRQEAGAENPGVSGDAGRCSMPL